MAVWGLGAGRDKLERPKLSSSVLGYFPSSSGPLSPEQQLVGSVCLDTVSVRVRWSNRTCRMHLFLSLMKGIYWNDLQEAVQQIQHWLAVNGKFKNLARCLSWFSVCVGIPKKWVPKPERMDVSARRGQAGQEKKFPFPISFQQKVWSRLKVCLPASGAISKVCVFYLKGLH